MLIAAGALVAVAWIASYFWWPQVGFPWPMTGLDQTHDRGFLLMIEGRLFFVRQRVESTPAASIATTPTSGPTVMIGAGRLTDPPGAATMLSSADVSLPPDLPPGAWYWSADSRVLGALRIRSGQAGEIGEEGRARQDSGGGSLVMTPIEPGLAATSWRRAGFASGPLSTPRIRVYDIDVSAFWTRTAIPLWPFVLVAMPGLWMLLRGRRARIWASHGRCTACGYDLRETPDRCPECGEAFTPAGVAAVRTSPM